MRLHIFIAVLMMMFFFLQFKLWFESDGIADMLKLRRILAAQAAENTKLKKRNDELLFQIERLKNSQDGTEARARNELGMIKKNETFYQIVQ